jgi:aminopeptidase N
MSRSAILSVPNLTRDDARVRAELLHVDSYDVVLDLTDGGGKPSDRTFRSTTTVSFTAARAGSTFIDLIADKIHSATLNGAAVDTSGYTTEDGLVLPDLAAGDATNTLVIDADLLFTNTGEGLHRFVDPVDGETYLYTQFETADAKRVFACFDQPDLKATFTFHATVPDHWQVASNGAESSVEDLSVGKTIHFVTTPRMSPYIAAIVAGPYHVVRSHHDGIDLGLWCRTSLAEYLDAEELFTITRQGFDWYHQNFGLRYAFGKYDQLFVPEFNAGAMENAGCITFNELYVFRSKVTDARYERRAETILHEMAHMWFGDLVTMQWWDDLWLNESFATYISTLCQASATRWTNAWTTFANVEKSWAYRQDQLPSTQPISTDAPDVQTAEVNFDGITYAKGASVLKQLGAYVGTDAFLAGVRDYFAEHAYGNTTLADLLRALEKSSGRDLSEWSKVWLETAGISTIRPEFTLDEAGHYATFDLVQTAPTETATSNIVRPHRLAIGLYDDAVVDGRTTLVRTGRLELDVVGERTSIDDLIGRAQPDLLLVNDDDLAYCKVRLDERSLRTLTTGGIARLAESLPRALAWSAAWDMTRDGDLAARDYIALIVAGAGKETDIGLLQSLTRQALRTVDVYADPQWAGEGYRLLAEQALQELYAAAPGSDHQLAWAHAFLGAARGPQQTAIIADVLSGAKVIEGLALDDEMRWAFVQALASRGAYSAEQIEAEQDRDPTAAGIRHAATTRALVPTEAAKAEAWRLAVDDDTLANATQQAVIVGFANQNHDELLTPYITRYFEQVHEVWDRRTSELAQNMVVGMFPSWSAAVAPSTVTAADAFLAQSGLPAALRRLVSEGRADVVRALRARATDQAAANN